MTLQSMTLFAPRITLTNCRLKKQILIRCVLSVCWFWRFTPNKPELRQNRRCFAVCVIKEILPLFWSDFSMLACCHWLPQRAFISPPPHQRLLPLFFTSLDGVRTKTSICLKQFFFWQEEQMMSARFHKINGRAKIVRVKAKRNATFIGYNTTYIQHINVNPIICIVSVILKECTIFPTWQEREEACGWICFGVSTGRERTSRAEK